MVILIVRTYTYPMHVSNLSIYLSVCLSIYLSIYLSYLSYLSIYIYLQYLFIYRMIFDNAI